jgi:hypothetical protein
MASSPARVRARRCVTGRATLLCLLLAPWPCTAWDTVPHRKITKAALDWLPKRVLARFGDQAAPLAAVYSLYPDRYAEMVRFGFVRKSAGPRSPEEIRAYCVRPDGQPIHSATGDRDMDMASLIYLFERILTSFSENRPTEAAKYAGVLAHFIEDSLSPPHAGDVEAATHAAIERSVPEFTLTGRDPHSAPHNSLNNPGGNLLRTAEAILDRIYAAHEQNRQDLPAMIKAVADRDEPTLDTYRLRAGVNAAEILADTLLAVGGTGIQP